MIKKERNYAVGKGKLDMSKVIKKGEVRNPLGINASPEKRMLRSLTEKTLSEAISSVFTSTREELDRMIRDPEVTVGHKIILKAAQDAEIHGNYTKFNEIIERVLGKIPFKTDVTTKGQSLNVTAEDEATVERIIKKVRDEY